MKVDRERFRGIVDDIAGMGTAEAKEVLEDLASSEGVDPTFIRMVKVALVKMKKDSPPIRRSKFPTDPGSLALDMKNRESIYDRSTLPPGGRRDLPRATRSIKPTKPK